MIRLFATTILLLLLTFGLRAQINTSDKEKAKSYIEQAKKHASEQEFGLVAQYLQKAYDVSPNLLDCYSIQLLGVSYYMMENSSQAIKFLELSTKCESDKEELALLYIYLSDSYLDMENYKQAVESSLKAISNNTDDEAIAVIYEEIANMHFDNEQPDLTIEAMQKSVAHYLKSLSITEDDVMRGDIVNEALGKCYFSLTWFASALNIKSVMLDAVIKSALCGNKEAIDFCQQNNIAYKEAIVMPISSSKDDATATALIEQALEHASKEEFDSIIPKLEKAYHISPAMFDGKTYHLMGLSYFMLSHYPLAIEYFERALQFGHDKEGLYFIYGTLADAYVKEEDYIKALKNAENALYLASGNEDILKSSLRLASIFYALEDYSSTIDSYQNAIRYYMKVHSITDAEVMRGKVKDEFLANTYMKLTSLLNDAMRGDESDHYLEKAALCGSEWAVEILEKAGE